MKAWLEGSTYDLEFLAAHLPAGDIRVGREGEKFYLSSPRLDNLPGGSGLLLDVAEDLIESVNGLGRLLNPGFERIALTGAFTTNGDVTVAAATAHLVARSQLMATAVALGPDGAPVPQPPSVATRYMGLAATNAPVADLLKIMGRGEGLNWDDLYQVDEVIKRTGRIKAAMQAAGISETTRSRFKQTANYEARHAQTGQAPPANPMELAAARTMMRQLAVAWLDSL